MRQDIDQLMQDRGLDALVVLGAGQHNPFMVYLMGGAHLTRAYLIKKRGASPLLFHRAMERDEASKSGLPCKSIEEYRPDQLLQESGGDVTLANARLLKRMFEELGLLSGRISFYGQMESGEVYSLLNALQKEMPQLSLVGEVGNSTLLTAMETKDEQEMARIRKMGEIATEVFKLVANYLQAQEVDHDMLVDSQGRPITIGEVKRRINLWLAMHGAENPHGTILAIGKDAGVPHSVGNDADPIRLGKTIVFDLFPCEAQGGYYSDMTRTWCLGYASDEIHQLYEDVLHVYQAMLAEIEAGKPLRTLQLRACEMFQSQGHATILEAPLTEKGFVHSLGHGLGLHIHERPFLRSNADEDERLKPCSVVTLEPGLYYPQREMGIRLEDTLWISPDGKAEVLTEFPLDLVLPIG